MINGLFLHIVDHLKTAQTNLGATAAPWLFYFWEAFGDFAQGKVLNFTHLLTSV